MSREIYLEIMKQWKVVVWPSGKPRTETIVFAGDFWDARRVAAAMFGCKESDISGVTEVK